jgi:putative transposase
MKKRFTEEQIIHAIKRLEGGLEPKTLCRELGIHMQTLYVWKRKYQGLEVADAKRLMNLESENAKLKRMLANAMIEIDDIKFLLSKNF